MVTKINSFPFFDSVFNGDRKKVCQECKESKGIAEFNVNKRTGNVCDVCKSCRLGRLSAWKKQNPNHRVVYYRKHREMLIKQSVEYNKKHKTKRRYINKTWRWRLRLKTIEAYGGFCVCCGEKTPEFLTIDHINNDGNVERKIHGLSGAALYRFLKDSGFPKDRYQLLCMNCNFAKGHFSECTHTRKQS